MNHSIFCIKESHLLQFWHDLNQQNLEKKNIIKKASGEYTKQLNKMKKIFATFQK